MKKFKNAFLVGIILFIGGLLMFQLWTNSFSSAVDYNSYIILREGKGYKNEIWLHENQREALKEGDIIMIAEKSFWVIEWWDGSITRLWENTKLQIEENQIPLGSSHMRISFRLLSGKTWSNIVSFLGDDASFIQKFDTIEAWIRGTVFEVDMEKWYIHVQDHEVALVDTTSWKNISVAEGQIFDFMSFEFLDIVRFVAELKNESWERINLAEDALYIMKLKNNYETLIDSKLIKWRIYSLFSRSYKILYLLETADDYEIISQKIQGLEAEKKEKLYNTVYELYQDIYFAKVNDIEYYRKKLFYKRALIQLGGNTSLNQKIVDSTAYDLEDILLLPTKEFLSETLQFVEDAQLKMGNLDSFLEKVWILPQEERSKIVEQMLPYKDIFIDTIKNNEIDILNQGLESLLEQKDNLDGKMQDFLDKKAAEIVSPFK